MVGVVCMQAGQILLINVCRGVLQTSWILMLLEHVCRLAVVCVEVSYGAPIPGLQLDGVLGNSILELCRKFCLLLRHVHANLGCTQYDMELKLTYVVPHLC